MGQQQLLLIALAIIVVGVGIAISVQLFRSNAISTKRDLLIDESHNIAAIAIAYYKRPVQFGGGGKSFIGWEVPESMVVTANGTYTATVFADSIIIRAVGTELVTDNDSIEVKTSVYSDSYRSTIIH
ncbi:MAG: hypothetical protein HXY49_00405 [Ignavibacteriaceae bacterium]|nr:hypothetical protein [Ignavibacteriaceae bacterium]